METWGRRVVLSAVFVVWLVNFLFQFDAFEPIAGPDFESSEAINVIFTLMIGWRFARRDRGED